MGEAGVYESGGGEQTNPTGWLGFRSCPYSAVLLLVFLAAVVVTYPGVAVALERVTFGKDTEAVVLGHHLEYLEDSKGKWSIDDVRSDAISSRFAKTTDEVPSFGFTRSAYWFRVVLRGEARERQTRLLEIGQPLLDHIELYVGRGRGLFTKYVAGDVHPFHTRAIEHRNFVFPVEIFPGKDQTIYLRLKSESAIQAPLILWSPMGLQKRDQVRQLGLGLFYGLMVVMIFYNLFLYTAIRDRSYLYYVLFVTSVSVALFSLDGLAQQYLWPSSPWWANCAIPFAIHLSCLWGVLFAGQFLDTRRHFPRWGKTLSVVAIATIAGAVVSFVAAYSVAIRVSIFAILVSATLLLVVGFMTWRKGLKAARYFILGWTAPLLGAVVMGVSRLGVLPRTSATELAMYFGMGTLVVLLSFALADRINTIREEKAQAQKAALEVQRQAAGSLEQEVARKTLDLQRTTDEAIAAKEELARAYDRLAEHDRLKSRFFSNVSHELRTPLTLILTPLERLLCRPADTTMGAVRDQLVSMAGNSQRLLRLVNQLLDFSRLDSGATTVSSELTEIGSLVEPLVQGFVPFAQSKGLKLDLRTADDVPPVYVDRVKLEKVVTNLLSNACKFTRPGGAVLVRLVGADGTVRLSVKDTGIGIAEQELPRIFERFHQADDGAARRYDGTGIGLALSMELVDLMGGQLEVESDVGVGSTFTVVLPVGQEHIQSPNLIGSAAPDEALIDGLAHARAAATALAAESGMRDTPAAAEGTLDHVRDRPAGQKPLMLVVEDNRDMRSLVAEICQEDFDVIEAENGLEGLEKLRQQRPAVAVLDVMMPEMDGHEVLRQVRADPATETIPVILLTAKAGPEMKLDGLERGADDYLAKPFESRELLARARNLLRLQQKEAELRDLNSRLQQEVVKQTSALERATMLRRYLPPEIAQSVLEQGKPVQIAQERHRLTVFRAELRGFGQLVKQIDPEDMTAMLNGYLSEMVEVAFAHGATVDKFIRDTIVGFFGAPTSAGLEEDAARGARLAVAMWKQALEVCSRWRRLLEGAEPPVPTVVLASGRAAVGNFGSSRRLEYTAVGGPVDEAEELLPLVDTGNVACSQSTWALLDGNTEAQTCKEVTVPGGSRPIKLYRLAGLASEVAVAKDATTPVGREAQDVSQIVSPADLTEGVVLKGRYRVMKLLGEGGMGAVFQAHDLKLGTDVALKMLRKELSQDPKHRARVYREVKLAQLVSHRNVARIYDLQEWDSHEFISMECIKGQTLAQRLGAEGALRLKEGCAILGQLCSGLAAAHVSNVVHRDLKPSNIMLEMGGRVVILDFGIARYCELLHTGSETRDLVGSPIYMAPEQFEKSKEVDHRADIYSLGVVAFEMFTGTAPFKSDNPVALAYMHVNKSPPDPLTVRPDLPPRLVAAILRCLQKSPDSRFGSVVEVASLLSIRA